MSELKFVSFRQSRTRQKSKNHFKAAMESFSWNSSRLSEKWRNSLIFSSAQNWQGARCLNLNSLFNSRVWTETLPTGLHCCRTSFKWQSTLMCMIQHSLLIELDHHCLVHPFNVLRHWQFAVIKDFWTQLSRHVALKHVFCFSLRSVPVCTYRPFVAQRASVAIYNNAVMWPTDALLLIPC